MTRNQQGPRSVSTDVAAKTASVSSSLFTLSFPPPPLHHFLCCSLFIINIIIIIIVYFLIPASLYSRLLSLTPATPPSLGTMRPSAAFSITWRPSPDESRVIGVVNLFTQRQFTAH